MVRRSQREALKLVPRNNFKFIISTFLFTYTGNYRSDGRWKNSDPVDTIAIYIPIVRLAQKITEKRGTGSFPMDSRVTRMIVAVWAIFNYTQERMRCKLRLRQLLFLMTWLREERKSTGAIDGGISLLKMNYDEKKLCREIKDTWLPKLTRLAMLNKTSNDVQSHLITSRISYPCVFQFMLYIWYNLNTYISHILFVLSYAKFIISHIILYLIPLVYPILMSCTDKIFQYLDVLCLVSLVSRVLQFVILIETTLHFLLIKGLKRKQD